MLMLQSEVTCKVFYMLIIVIGSEINCLEIICPPLGQKKLNPCLPCSEKRPNDDLNLATYLLIHILIIPV